MTDTEPTPAPTNELELRDAVKELLRTSRHERDQWDSAIATLKGYLESPLKGAARHVIEELGKKEPLEFKWRIEELLEETAPAEPKKAAPPEPEPEPEAVEPEAAEPPPDAGVVAPLRPEDLLPIYDDPRGLMMHRHRIDGRWFLTQVNPMTGQPQTMELSAQQRGQIQQELAGSPHWIEKEWDVNPGPSSPIL
ncbi:MAG: hypothetical protein AAF645_18895 [Myxococcota bacterium]